MDAYEINDAYTPIQRAVILYAEEMTRKVSLSDKTFDAVRKVLSEQELVELTMTVAFANFTNRLNEAFKTDLEH